MESLVSTDWLADHLGDPALTIVDSSWHMPATWRNGRDEFFQAHIPGAVFLDIDAVSDASDPAPHMLPRAAEFARAMEKIGIGSTDRIVVYDNSPLRSAARGWFMLRHFGAGDVAILDGGLQKWIAEGRPTTSGEAESRNATFDATEREGEVVTKQQILDGLACTFVDARGPSRFEGTEPEPRPGVESGHIPGARNIPFGALYNADGTFRSREEIRRIFEEARANPNQPFVASCGSGVTAVALIFAAHLLGSDSGRLYDGSWSEWGADPATPKELGPAA
jgi:thiosulfate/3-mercaptopyruvate sulfurtransferase